LAGVLHFDTSYRSSNYNARSGKIEAIIVHSSEGVFPTDLQWLCNPHSHVSSHYLIAPSGDIYQLVADDKRAWHAGMGVVAGNTDPNNIAIGIEVSHMHGIPYTAVQLDRLTTLCQSLMLMYHIPPALVLSHRSVARPKGRKSDPTSPPLSPELAFRVWANGLVKITQA